MNKSVIIVLVLILTACGGEESGSKKNCDAFSTQAEAQAYFNKYNATNLDRDNDGIACEHLPNGSIPPQDISLNNYIGVYTLLGESCEIGVCTPQSVTLNVKSSSYITICTTTKILDGCDASQANKFDISIEDNLYLFDGGKVKFGSLENGHLSLEYKSSSFYGQNVLSTDTYENNMYSQEGILIKDKSLSLTSKFGQSVVWNETDGLTVNND